MSLNGILDLLEYHPEFSSAVKSAENDGAGCAIVRQGARPAFIASLARRRKGPLLVITPRPEDARRLHDHLLSWLGDDAPVHLLPEPEVLPFERLAVDANTGNQRLATLAALAQVLCHGQEQVEESECPKVNPVVVASIGSALLYTMPPLLMAGLLPGSGNPCVWRVGDRVRIDEVLSQWLQLGYRHEPVVESPGAFSHRGGILDIFPPDCELPLRIELFDDEIDTIRRFDPLTQRSVGAADEVRPIPAREQLPGMTGPDTLASRANAMNFSRCGVEVRERIEEELETLAYSDNTEVLSFYSGLVNRACLLDYLDPSTGSGGASVLLERGGRVEAEASELEERLERMRTAREDRGELPANFPSPFVAWTEFAARLTQFQPLDLQGWVGEEDDPVFLPATPYYGRLEQLSADQRRRQGDGAALVAVTQHARRVAEILEQQGVGVSVQDGLEGALSPGQVCIIPGSLPGGWTVELPVKGKAGRRNGTIPRLDLLTDAELFGTVKERRHRRHRRAERGPDVSLADLVPGTFVVHIDHGVARFAGTTQMGENGDQREYLVLEYAESDKLYVPTDHLNRVSAYVGAQEHAPALTRLGAADWTRIKQKVKGAAREMAQELIRTNAAREIARGHEFSPDTVWQQELEDSFPYIETPDQAQAINDVKADMELSRPMDRLICGDVGYGKTEVALRAAFKTVNDGMQVGLLVPTTVLAQQHYATFTERLSPFPVRVEVLSRFRTPKEQQEVIEGLKSGEVDIVVGTHRLLQKDVQFKNLGLAVVDEEQRFGVSHKERLKQLRRQVDVLTLSATPIPRTLNMALSGLRDLSSMSSAPEERLPVKTFVSEYSEDVVKEAILREMERGGQVFYLHNRVRSIHQAAEDIRRLVPQARVAIGHGQMAESDLEDVMVDFANGEADVLVCTTIIESGLDMPNVNTLIVERADRFGLAQLYQLRGRVGRSQHRAYAYLLAPRGRSMTEAAEMRLQAILDASDLGAGFRIAMRDLEIRGAGNVLGADQSGHIQEVGLDLYTQLLQEAVRELERDQESGHPELVQGHDEPARIEIPLPAGIPDDYIAHLPTRLAVYQRLAKLTERRELPEIREELRDRFGPVPEEVESLMKVAEIRALAGAAGAESVIRAGDSIVISLRNSVGGAKAPLQRALGPAAQVGNAQIQMPLRTLGDQWLQRLTRTLERLQVFMDNMRQLAADAHRS
ncbi:MAG: transcription-repair coupling factor [Chloroflexi bacterium]|nr:transcription-repair coupling factor [Chloroflexota bacterium]